MRNELRSQAAQSREHDHDDRRRQRATVAKLADQQATADRAEQDGHESPHLDHAVAARDLVRVKMLRQVRVLHGAEDGRLQAEQENGQVHQPRRLQHESRSADQHDAHFGVLDAADEPRLFQLVGKLAAGRREQHEGRNEKRTDQEAGHARLDAAPARSGVGRQQRKGELEDVVVGRAEELDPEQRREAALTQQGKLVPRAHTGSVSGVVDVTRGSGPVQATRPLCQPPPRPDGPRRIASDHRARAVVPSTRQVWCAGADAGALLRAV